VGQNVAIGDKQSNNEVVKEFVYLGRIPDDTKTNRLRYAGHVIRRPEDLPQKAICRAKPNGRRNQGRPKSRCVAGVNSGSLALGVRDSTHCGQDRQTCRDLLQQALTRYWL
jgi:hypothetical protein